MNYKITINRNLQIGHQDLLRTSWWVHSIKTQTLGTKESENEKAAKGKRQELGLGSLSIEQKNKTSGKTQRDHKELGLLIW